MGGALIVNEEKKKKNPSSSRGLERQIQPCAFAVVCNISQRFQAWNSGLAPLPITRKGMTPELPGEEFL